MKSPLDLTLFLLCLNLNLQKLEFYNFRTYLTLNVRKVGVTHEHPNLAGRSVLNRPRAAASAA